MPNAGPDYEQTLWLRELFLTVRQLLVSGLHKTAGRQSLKTERSGLQTPSPCLVGSDVEPRQYFLLNIITDCTVYRGSTIATVTTKVNGKTESYIISETHKIL